jgi:hypothetical protein
MEKLLRCAAFCLGQNTSCGGTPISIVRQYIEQQQDTPLKDKGKDSYAVRAILPRPEWRGLPRTGSAEKTPGTHSQPESKDGSCK